MSCDHDKYRDGHHMPAAQALRSKVVCWTGIRIKNCEDCGEEINVVPFKTAREIVRERVG